MFKHQHPYDVFIKDTTTKIIVGTLPPPRFCSKELKDTDVDFCYGSSDNLLWKVLDEIYNLNLLYNNSKEAIKQRKVFLEQKNIGICDIVEFCYRNKIDASDIGMKEPIEKRDILKYLKEYPNIDTIIFTGGYCKNSPEYFLRQVLKKQNIKFENSSQDIPKTHNFYFENRQIKTISLTSPSNAANRAIGANKLYKENKIKDSDYTTFDFRVEQYKKVFL